MLESAHADVAASAAAFLQHPEFLACAPIAAAKRPVPSLALRMTTDRLKEDLLDAGCSSRSTAALLRICEAASDELGRVAQTAFARTVEGLQGACGGDRKVEDAWTGAVRQGYERQFSEASRRLEDRFLDEVRLARSRSWHAQPPSTTPTVPMNQQEPGTFTAEVLTILQTAFSVRDAVTRAERRELARVTGLSERQILTWFANQRQRRNKPKRASPYETPRRPLQQQREYQHHPPLRTVSGSSSSSSLVPYATAFDNGVDIPIDAPQYAQSQHGGEGDVDLLPASGGADFASFAQQFQVAPLPLPVPPQLEHEVPMMEFTSPTPVAASFFPRPVPSSSDFLPPSRPSHPAPPAVEYSYSPQSSNGAAAVADELSFLPTAPPFPPVFSSTSDAPSAQLDWDDSLSSLSSGFIPVAPAPTLSSSFADALRVSMEGMDTFLDETFFENLLGSLGLSGAPSSSTAGGGLTLSMESVRQDVAVEGGGGVEGGWQAGGGGMGGLVF
ncbi:hypothetical protein JCM8547_006993 [Rhodosporidiobolus lusitaniae]